jgi:hypothetical protein
MMAETEAHLAQVMAVSLAVVAEQEHLSGHKATALAALSE